MSFSSLLIVLLGVTFVHSASLANQDLKERINWGKVGQTVLNVGKGLLGLDEQGNTVLYNDETGETFQLSDEPDPRFIGGLIKVASKVVPAVIGAFKRNDETYVMDEQTGEMIPFSDIEERINWGKVATAAGKVGKHLLNNAGPIMQGIAALRGQDELAERRITGQLCMGKVCVGRV